MDDPPPLAQSPSNGPNLPSDVLFTIFSVLPPEDVSRCGAVCVSWRSVATLEALWKGIAKRTLSRHHPEPKRPPDTPELPADGALSLSESRQLELDAELQFQDARLTEFRAAQERRREVVALFRRRVVENRGSFRRSYLAIPQTRVGGVYVARHEYCRKGVRDMFHNYDGILQCVYHRVVWLRPEDHSVTYLMCAGTLDEAIRSMKRMQHAGAVAPAAAGGSAAALQGLGASTFGTGHYSLLGTSLTMTIRNTSSHLSTRWVCELSGTYWNRLSVMEMQLMERGEEGAAAPMREVEGLEWFFRPVEWMH